MSGVDWTLVGPPFLAGLLVLATHVPLGLQVLARGIVFMDLAIAQLAVVGVLATARLGWEPQGLAMQAVALASAIAGSLALTWVERRWPQVQEAVIGVLFVVAAATGVLLMAHDPHGGERLADLLAGQILWVGWDELTGLAAVTVLLLAVLWASRGAPRAPVFYGMFAVAVTASVQMVGVYLVFASLIVPALAVRGLSFGRALAGGVAIGGAGYALGLWASTRWDWPAGALIVWGLVLAAGVAAALRHGLRRG